MKNVAIEKKLIGLLFICVLAVFTVAEKESRKLDELNAELYPKSTSADNTISTKSFHNIPAADHTSGASEKPAATDMAFTGTNK